MTVRISSFEKQGKKITSHTSKCNTQDNGNRNVDKIFQMCAAALCHSRKCGKQHDHINIITGSACQDHLGNAFGCAVFFIHQLYHSWDNYSRGYRTHYSAHYSRFQSGNSQKIRCQQKVSQDFESCRNAGHHDGRTTHFLQIGKIQGKSRFQQDNDQRNLPQLR